jgi:hypothetical protein
MLVSLVGGSRAVSRVAAESSSEETTESAEFAHRLVDCSQRSLGRRVASRLERLTVAHRRGRASLPGVGVLNELGSVSSRGHELANGLCAPQRC